MSYLIRKKKFETNKCEKSKPDPQTLACKYLNESGRQHAISQELTSTF